MNFAWRDGYDWHFWWMFPLMMLCMIVIFAVIFFLAQGFCGDGCHHWGRPSRMWGDPSHSPLQILNENAVRAAQFRRTSMRRKRLRSSRWFGRESLLATFATRPLKQKAPDEAGALSFVRNSDYQRCAKLMLFNSAHSVPLNFAHARQLHWSGHSKKPELQQLQQ